MANTWIVGGKGTMADASDNNGGGFVNGVNGTYANSIDTNGGPVDSPVECTLSESGGAVQITKASGFTNTEEGHYANCIRTYGSEIPEGIYAVLTVVDGSNIIIDLAWNALYASDKITCNVGGAFATIQSAFDLLANGEDECLIATDTSTVTEYTSGTKLSLPTTAAFGGTGDAIVIRGCDKADGGWLGVSEEKPEITSSTSALASLLELIDDNEGYKFYDVVFDGTKALGNDATACLALVGGTAYYPDDVFFFRCVFKNALSYGVHWNARAATHCGLYDCTIIDNGSTTSHHGVYGQYSAPPMINCTVTGNSGDGIYTAQPGGGQSIITGCVIADNGGRGIYKDRYFTRLKIVGNTIANNASHGFEFSYSSTPTVYTAGVFSHNIFYGNTGDALYTAETTLPDHIGFTKNCLNGNANDTFTGYTQVMDDATNITTDPKFKSESTGDYRLTSGSSCLNTTTGKVIGALGPEESAGGLITHPGMGGGMRG
ncbi:MAG: right-handed parallel beta-helix repeat-containing protein [FCB group bacterium]|nr:right-handed parallel beta-helix repeat-containing protein [FCB group bacterium]